MDKKHPSGRPIQIGHIVSRPIWRIPDEGYLTPRLRQDKNITAIGFTAKIVADDEL